ncbi:heme NO-binding protein [Pseudoruegeria sp. SK021]|nr:heme NO-binding domain-containing protein [Pseudoruegeria sp. SK021]OSP54304.1 heme NO-binding protein [Pseudoruegeria sp. SK021]
MHGLMNRAVQCFVRDTYGVEMWKALAYSADVPMAGFEAMFVYDDAMTDRMLDGATRLLNRPQESILEDIGTYIVSHPNVESLRRLLRFGGETFLEFLLSVDDLPRRARLAVPDLGLPAMEIIEGDYGAFELICRGDRPGFGHVMVGLLRTMADDYGALVVLDYEGRNGLEETISIQILQNEFTEGRPFELATGPFS